MSGDDESVSGAPCLPVLHSDCTQTCTAEPDSLTSSCGRDRTGRGDTSALQRGAGPRNPLGSPATGSGVGGSLGSKLGCKCIPFFFSSRGAPAGPLAATNARGTNRSKKKSKLLVFSAPQRDRSLTCGEGRSKKKKKKQYNEGLKAAAASHKDFRSSRTETLPVQGRAGRAALGAADQLGESGPRLLTSHRVAMERKQPGSKFSRRSLRPTNKLGVKIHRTQNEQMKRFYTPGG